MTIAKALREALTAAGADGLNESKLADKAGISIAELRKVVWAMVNRGEVEKADQDGVVTYTLDPDYSKNRKLPVKRKNKKKKTTKKPRGGNA